MGKERPVQRQRAIDLHEASRVRFDKGDKSAILEAVFVAANCNMKLPNWAADAFEKYYYEAVELEMHKSWDEVFGPPMPKGVHVGKKLADGIRWDLHSYIKVEHEDGIPLGDGLFEAAGRAFGVSKTKANELYYSVENYLKQINRIVN
jgi:hypothetical protein